MSLQVLPEFDVLAFQLSISVGNENPGDHPSAQCKRGADKKHSLGTFLNIGERILNRREDLCPNRRTCLSHRRRKAQEVSSDRRWETLRAAEKGRNARSHLSEAVEDAVEDDEERKD